MEIRSWRNKTIKIYSCTTDVLYVFVLSPLEVMISQQTASMQLSMTLAVVIFLYHKNLIQGFLDAIVVKLISLLKII